MKIIEFINLNHDMLVSIHRIGILSHTVFFYRNLWNDHDINIKKGLSITDSAIITADKFSTTDRTVFRALKVMNSRMSDELIADRKLS